MKKIIFLLMILCQLELSAQAKYIVPCKFMLLEASLDSAISQVGTLELTGNNDGRVEKYLKSVGLRIGMPYCAAGQYWCFYTSAIDIRIPISEIPIKKTGLANSIYDDAKIEGKKVKYSPAKHDLIIWRKRKSWQGHIERVYKVGKRGWVWTIGFNTSENTRNGKVHGVFIKKRNIFHLLNRMLVRGLVGFNPIYQN